MSNDLPSNKGFNFDSMMDLHRQSEDFLLEDLSYW